MYSTVFVAGYGNSEPLHWQRLWFNSTKDAYWVEQRDWNAPNKDEWIKELEKTLSHVKSPVVIIAHSIGCHTVVEWVKKYYKNQDIIGVLLVAPPDTSRENFPKEITGHEHTPKDKLPFKSISVISSNDPYSAVQNAESLALSWESKVVHVGERGHINLDSNLGEWEEGKAILSELRKTNS